MPTPTKGPRLGSGPAHERRMLANLATNLIEHNRITTTEAKAKRLQPVVERLITKAKRGDLHAIREITKVIRSKTPNRRNEPGDASTAVHKLMNEIAPAMAERHGGYTRITKIGPRKGDNAPMAVIELVMEPVSPKQAVVREATKAAKKAAPKAAPKVEEKVEEAPAEETTEETVQETAAEEAPAEETVEEEKA